MQAVAAVKEVDAVHLPTAQIVQVGGFELLLLHVPAGHAATEVITVEGTVWVGLTVYVPIPPVPVTLAVIVVPVIVPVPEMAKELRLCAVLIVYVPVEPAQPTRTAVIVVPAVMAVPEIAFEVTACVALTVYVADVNTPSQPAITAVMVVPVIMPLPEIVWPTAIVPDATAVTVSVVPSIDPVNAETPPEIVWPTAIVPDATAVTVSVAPSIDPVNAEAVVVVPVVMPVPEIV